jgi:hypothetical protein
MKNYFDLKEYTSEELDHLEVGIGAGINLAKSQGNKDMELNLIAIRNTVNAARRFVLQKEADLWAAQQAKNILNNTL